MIFVAMTEYAITFIEAPSHFDAVKFAPAELDAGDDPVVVELAVGGDKVRPDVALKWFGSDAGTRPDRGMMVGRVTPSGVLEWRSGASDRERRGVMLATEDRPIGIPHIDRLHEENLAVADAPPAVALSATLKGVATIVSPVPFPSAPTLPDGTEIRVVPSSPNAWLEWAQKNIEALNASLTATQERCNSLLDEARFARRERDAWFETVVRFVGLSETQRQTRLGAVVVDLLRERCRQDAKWGPIGAKYAPQDALAIPFGTGGEYSREMADLDRALCDTAFQRGEGTWAHVLNEELSEVLAETDPVKLREELIQLGAVCMKCVEIIDWKAGA